MRKYWRLMGLLLMPALAAAAPDVLVADTRHLTGIRAWWGTLYNQSHLQFALVTIVAIPLAGVILGSLTDFAIRQIGIDLKSRTLREN